MAMLYVTEPDATVRLTSRSIQITVRPADRAGSPVVRGDVELHRLDFVALLGGVHITRDAVDALLEQGVGLAWLDRSGRLRGRVVPSSARSIGVRFEQFRRFADRPTRVVRARSILHAKTANARAVLKGLQSNNDWPGLAEALADLKQRDIDLERVDDLPALLGLEGSAAASYFNALGGAFRSEITFTARSRRPPTDPANALLSFAYVLLNIRLAGLLEARGLDPAFGFLHEPRAGRESLALDLLEEIRHPIADRFVLRTCNLRIMRPEHFELDADKPGGVRMTSAGLKLFFREWETWLAKPVRDAHGESIAPVQLFARQVDRLAADLHGGDPYAPFLAGA